MILLVTRVKKLKIVKTFTKIKKNNLTWNIILKTRSKPYPKETNIQIVWLGASYFYCVFTFILLLRLTTSRRYCSFRSWILTYHLPFLLKIINLANCNSVQRCLHSSTLNKQTSLTYLVSFFWNFLLTIFVLLM